MSERAWQLLLVMGAATFSTGVAVKIDSGDHPIERIVNGELTEPYEFPGILSLGLTSWASIMHLHQCAGSLIAENWVLTSAGCVLGAVNNTGLYYWLAGTYHLHLPGITRNIQRIVQHPNYNPNESWIHDLALTQLDKPIVFSISVQPLILKPSIDMSMDTEFTVAGWGQVSETLIQPSVLRKTTVKLSDGDFCRNAYAKWNLSIHEEFQFCAGSRDEVTGVCDRDTGGPLFLKNSKVIVGVISWRYGCGLPEYPTVYVRLSSYIEWMSQVTGLFFYL
ncbi:trypsin-7-like [Cephus cinctus]|uniref:Trypsin-7-like n=1 Tax=Cephus cinctus TaxID=211228 RepID=A0AAJ7RJM7_CEPCN|nr:trypsin-7-like [Cephus cinctus]XP_024941818.1 trypsin-7-like [Cephus cinctus]XP_024941819.1 trypsin-7-like [Cephus cinctus]